MLVLTIRVGKFVTLSEFINQNFMLGERAVIIIQVGNNRNFAMLKLERKLMRKEEGYFAVYALSAACNHLLIFPDFLSGESSICDFVFCALLCVLTAEC